MKSSTPFSNTPLQLFQSLTLKRARTIFSNGPVGPELVDGGLAISSWGIYEVGSASCADTQRLNLRFYILHGPYAAFSCFFSRLGSCMSNPARRRHSLDLFLWWRWLWW